MNAAVAPGDPMLILLLAGAALLVLIIGSWLGRWTLWVLGYLLAIAAVVVSLAWGVQ